MPDIAKEAPTGAQEQQAPKAEVDGKSKLRQTVENFTAKLKKGGGRLVLEEVAKPRNERGSGKVVTAVGVGGAMLFAGALGASSRHATENHDSGAKTTNETVLKASPVPSKDSTPKIDVSRGGEASSKTGINNIKDDDPKHGRTATPEQFLQTVDRLVEGNGLVTIDGRMKLQYDHAKDKGWRFAGDAKEEGEVMVGGSMIDPAHPELGSVPFVFVGGKDNDGKNKVDYDALSKNQDIDTQEITGFLYSVDDIDRPDSKFRKAIDALNDKDRSAVIAGLQPIMNDDIKRNMTTPKDALKTASVAMFVTAIKTAPQAK